MQLHIQGQSYQFKALPFGLPTDHTPMDFTVVQKDVKLTKGYKNPPVPGRLVGQSQIPPNLSPAYTDSSSYLSGVRLVSQHREIGTGPQTSLAL